MRLWNAVTGEHKGTLTGHARGVLSVAFSPDGKNACQWQLGPDGVAMGYCDMDT